MRKIAVLEEASDAVNLITDKYEGFIFDMDGVIWRGDALVEGVVEMMGRLKAKNKQVFFATNNSTATRNAYLKRLHGHGIHVAEEERIYCSAAACADYLKSVNYKGKVFVLGGEPIIEELRKIPGIEPLSKHIDGTITPAQMALEPVDTDIGAVVVGFDPLFSYYRMCYASVIIRYNPDALFLVTNRDMKFPTNGWVLPGTGTFVKAVELAAGRDGITVGKPGPFIIDCISKNFTIPKEKLVMIGDNLLTDIEFANSNNICSVLVESGVHTRLDAYKAPEIQKPTYVIPSAASL